MNKSMILGMLLLGACLAGWVSSRAVGQPESSPGQESRTPSTNQPASVIPNLQVIEPQQTGIPQDRKFDPTKDDPKKDSFRPAPNIPQNYFPVVQDGIPSTKAPQRPNDSKMPMPSRSGAFPGDVKPAQFNGSGSSLPADAPVEDAPGQSNENPTGRQEPSVSLEWIGPPTAKLGQAVTYQIIVKNTGAIPVQNVTVRNRVPAGVTVQATEPRAINELNTLIWELGTLQPRQEKRLDLQLLPEMRGDLASQAFVSFTGMSQARIRVREPKLTLKAAGPDKVLLGDAAPFSLTVTNPGDGSADQVKIRAVLSDGLEHTRGKAVEFDLGNLGPNETRSVQLVCTAKSGGPQSCEAVAVAEGGLKAQDTAMLEVLLPRLELNIAGPHLRYLERKATFVLKVVNPGSAAASNVTVTNQIPDGFKFLSATDGGRHDFATRSVSWYLGDLTPGQSREMSIELMAINTGEHRQQATVTAARGLKNDADITTRIEGLSALLMELVDLDDPVEVGSDTAYEIRVVNTGSKTETNLQLTCTIPEKMEFRGATGGAGARFHLQGKELTFEPIPRLAPRADVVFRVNVRGVGPGDMRFRARIIADGLSEPVLKEESTKVYGDDVIK